MNIHLYTNVIKKTIFFYLLYLTPQSYSRRSNNAHVPITDGGSRRSAAEQLDLGGALPRRRDKGLRHRTGGGSRQATSRSCCRLPSTTPGRCASFVYRPAHRTSSWLPGSISRRNSALRTRSTRQTVSCPTSGSRRSNARSTMPFLIHCDGASTD